MIILDTNVVSELFRPVPDPHVVSWLENLTVDAAITSITLAELLAGVGRLPDGKRKSTLTAAVESVVRTYADSQGILPFDHLAARHYADVVNRRANQGSPVSTADAQIAAICRAHDAVCATRNTKDFLGTGVELVNPWESRFS